MKKTILKAIKDNLPIVLYRLPGKQEVDVLIQREPKLPTYSFEEISSLRGFLMAPFRGDPVNRTHCIIADDTYRVNVPELADLLYGITSGDLSGHEPGGAYVMTEEEYLKRSSYLIETLRDGQLRKVVLSRVTEYPTAKIFQPGRFLQVLMEANPDAFVYLVRMPGIGTWTGATPEVLFRMDDNEAETVALAGTQPVERYKWTEKEIKEQRIVMDYIEELLFREKVQNYEREGPFTIHAGNVVHLKTTYTIPRSRVEGIIGRLIAGLHPTPAVCGLPRSKAYQLITKVEKHDRGFYSGFLGPWNLKGSAQLFVNLRCAEIFSDRFSLFIGGGLTAESKPASEWEETVRKSKTLLSILEKM